MQASLIALVSFQYVTRLCALEHCWNVGMGNQHVGLVRLQVLFRDISDIVGALILGEQVIIGLVLGWANLFWDRFIPFL